MQRFRSKTKKIYSLNISNLPPNTLYHFVSQNFVELTQDAVINTEIDDVGFMAIENYVEKKILLPMKKYYRGLCLSVSMNYIPTIYVMSRKSICELI